MRKIIASILFLLNLSCFALAHPVLENANNLSRGTIPNQRHDISSVTLRGQLNDGSQDLRINNLTVDGSINGVASGFSGGITSTNVVDGSLTGNDIAASVFTSSHIINGSLTGDDISARVIASTHIINGSITNAEIGAGSGSLHASTTSIRSDLLTYKTSVNDSTQSIRQEIDNGPILVNDEEGLPDITRALSFQGAGVTITGSISTKTVQIDGTILTADEGSDPVKTRSMNFVGAGISRSMSGSTATVTFSASVPTMTVLSTTSAGIYDAPISTTLLFQKNELRINPKTGYLFYSSVSSPVISQVGYPIEVTTGVIARWDFTLDAINKDNLTDIILFSSAANKISSQVVVLPEVTQLELDGIISSTWGFHSNKWHTDHSSYTMEKFFDFQRDTGTVLIPDNDILSLMAGTNADEGKFSIAFTVVPYDLRNTDTYWFSKHKAGSPFEWDIYHWGNNMTIQFMATNSSVLLAETTTAAPLVANVDNKILIAVNRLGSAGNRIRIYVNGTLQTGTETFNAGTVSNTSNPLIIGSNPAGGTALNNFNGIIKRIRMYADEKTQEDARLLNLEDR